MPTIQDGRDAIDQGNLQQARLIFEAILQETPRSEDAWMGLAEVLTNVDDKRICYENVLKINQNNRNAREALRNLEPQENPLIAALQHKAPRTDDSEHDDEFDDDQPALIGAETAASAAADGPPTYALVAIGLLLSVVAFAVGGGTVFFLITSFR